MYKGSAQTYHPNACEAEFVHHIIRVAWQWVKVLANSIALSPTGNLIQVLYRAFFRLRSPHLKIAALPSHSEGHLQELTSRWRRQQTYKKYNVIMKDETAQYTAAKDVKEPVVSMDVPSKYDPSSSTNLNSVNDNRKIFPIVQNCEPNVVSLKTVPPIFNCRKSRKASRQIEAKSSNWPQQKQPLLIATNYMVIYRLFQMHDNDRSQEGQIVGKFPLLKAQWSNILPKGHYFPQHVTINSYLEVQATPTHLTPEGFDWTQSKKSIWYYLEHADKVIKRLALIPIIILHSSQTHFHVIEVVVRGNATDASTVV